MKKIGTEITDEMAAELTGLYKTVNFAVRRSIASWLPLRRMVLRGLKGYFNPGEIDHLITIQRGMKFEPMFAVHVETLALRLRNHPKDKELKFKVDNLDGPQAMFLTDWIDVYLRAEKVNPDGLQALRKELLSEELEDK